MDIEAVEWWVQFWGGLVRLAERNAREFGAGEGYGGEGYEWEKWNREVSVGDWLEGMEMEEEGSVWYRGMMQKNMHVS